MGFSLDQRVSRRASEPGSKSACWLAMPSTVVDNQGGRRGGEQSFPGRPLGHRVRAGHLCPPLWSSGFTRGPGCLLRGGREPQCLAVQAGRPHRGVEGRCSSPGSGQLAGIRQTEQGATAQRQSPSLPGQQPSSHGPHPGGLHTLSSQPLRGPTPSRPRRALPSRGAPASASGLGASLAQPPRHTTEGSTPIGVPAQDGCVPRNWGTPPSSSPP